MAENERKITKLPFLSPDLSALGKYLKEGSTYIPIIRKQDGVVVIELREADNGGAE